MLIHSRFFEKLGSYRWVIAEILMRDLIVPVLVCLWLYFCFHYFLIIWNGKFYVICRPFILHICHTTIFKIYQFQHCCWFKSFYPCYQWWLSWYEQFIFFFWIQQNTPLLTRYETRYFVLYWPYACWSECDRISKNLVVIFFTIKVNQIWWVKKLHWKSLWPWCGEWYYLHVVYYGITKDKQLSYSSWKHLV